ncbi:hypothetical protein [Marinicella meishanensis]|uniref:hypothetical protein n=1 Tax=Marinicella meishanensis TaxID=2873263 RepID=UPI001CBCEB27|nr:hypothetical protein [Marinicella sp. NBU2979]
MILFLALLLGGSDPLDESTEVAYHPYSVAIDLTGKDTLTLTGSNKTQVGELFMPLLDQAQMARQKISNQQLRAMTGEMADEVHHFPHAQLGTKFHDATLLFKDGRLLQLKWSFRKKKQ